MQIGLQLEWTTDFFSWHYACARSFDLDPASYANALGASKLLQLQRRKKKKKNLADLASQRKVWPCLRNAIVRGVCPEILQRDRKGRQVWLHKGQAEIRRVWQCLLQYEKGKWWRTCMLACTHTHIIHLCINNHTHILKKT